MHGFRYALGVPAPLRGRDAPDNIRQKRNAHQFHEDDKHPCGIGVSVSGKHENPCGSDLNLLGSPFSVREDPPGRVATEVPSPPEVTFANW